MAPGLAAENHGGHAGAGIAKSVSLIALGLHDGRDESSVRSGPPAQSLGHLIACGAWVHALLRDPISYYSGGAPVTPSLRPILPLAPLLAHATRPRAGIRRR